MNRGFPSMTALLGMLAVAGYQNRDKLGELFSSLGAAHPGSAPQPGGQGYQQQTASNTGGLGGGIGGALGGLGGLLSNLGLGGPSSTANPGSIINGGIGDLVDRFRQAGKGDVADSWVRQGPNAAVTPGDLRDTIGADVLDTLSKHTGLSHDELLARLSTTLPGAVDQYTPNGHIPS